MFIILLWLCLNIIWTIESAVLDPALYLSPSPPLTITSDTKSPEELWSRSAEPRLKQGQEDLLVIPLEKKTTTITEPPEAMEKAETFWPSLRTTQYGIRGIHIPLTFSVSGTYGNYGSGASAGVVGSSYASVIDDDSSFGLFSNYGKSGLAGSSYGSYGSKYSGTRIYSSGGGPSWSGWGNGKWGHYGKG